MLALAIGGCGEEKAPPDPPSQVDRFDGDRAYADVAWQVELGPRPSGSEANARLTQRLARVLFRTGVKGVSISGADRRQSGRFEGADSLRNVVGVIPGNRDGFIVVGAHHDTKSGIPNFVGANDGGSGVAVVLELARQLTPQAPLQGPSIAIALFDGEEARGDRAFSEDGKRGSSAYVDLAEGGGKGAVPDLEEIRAMVLFDMVGDCELQIPLEANSSPELFSRFAAADPGLFFGETNGIDDDHVPFLQAGVKAVDLIDFTYGGDKTPGTFWHTPADTLDKVCADSLDRVGEAAVATLRSLP